MTNLYISFVASHTSNLTVTNIYISFIHLSHLSTLFISILPTSNISLCLFYFPHTRLTQVWPIFISVCRNPDSHLQVFYLPSTLPPKSELHLHLLYFYKIPVTDIHKRVTQLSHIFILLLFPSHTYELSISNIHFLCLTQVSANCEEYWYHLWHIHADLRWLWDLFIFTIKNQHEQNNHFFYKKNLTPKCWDLFAQYFFAIYFRNNLCVNPKAL